MKKILVVEDHGPLRLLYKEELEQDGYSVSAAANTESALEQIIREDFDLIIIEIGMPGNNGPGPTIEFLGKQSKARIIINTSYQFLPSDFMSWPADAYLGKSSCLIELRKTVRELLCRPAPKAVDPSQGSFRAGAMSTIAPAVT